MGKQANPILINVNEFVLWVRIYPYIDRKKILIKDISFFYSRRLKCPMSRTHKLMVKTLRYGICLCIFAKSIVSFYIATRMWMAPYQEAIISTFICGSFCA